LALGVGVVWPDDGAMSECREIIAGLAEPTRELRRAIPEAWAGFDALRQAAVGEGVLPARVPGGRLSSLPARTPMRCVRSVDRLGD
jgi:hypothetical protein